MLGKKTVLFTLIVLTGSFIFRTHLEELFESFKSLLLQYENNIEGIFSPAQLLQYNGVKKDKLYLALMGVVYDVTEGKRHYSSDAPYHYFVGKDGSRAFITGDFQDESEDKDNVLTLSCNELFNLLNWENTLKEKYSSVGLLIGRFYDEQGRKTEYSKLFDGKIDECTIEKEMAKKQEAKLPSCNMEWTSSEGTRVWCTRTSGGISRDWAGLPRQLYNPGGQQPRCVCVNPEDDHSSTLLKTYESCLETSSSCYVKN
ncbi:neuferricin homolog [Cydia pomonella]|uniref:neuferricin homolog n=1 Tax=Cydia pomonella TaxID=82600 RepID=UPI002ADD88F9|nr:neuferricin homolog [Cydia pomonella]